MQDSSQNNKRIAKNSMYMSVRMVFLLVLTLYTTRAILWVLGVEDYGIYNVVCGFVSMFSFLNLSMTNGIQRFYNYELGKHGVEGAGKVYNTALLIQTMVSGVIVLIVEGIGIWYLNNKMVIPADRVIAAKWVFHCSVLSIVLVIMQVPYSALVMAHEKMSYYAFVSVCNAILTLIMVYLIPYISGDGLIMYGWLIVFVNAIGFLLYFSYAKTKFIEVKFCPEIHKKMLFSMLGFSGWNLVGSMSGMLREHGVNLIMNLFFGPIVNAAKGVASQVSAGLQSFVQNIAVPARPQVIQSYAKGNIERTMHLTYSISKLSCMLLYMISVSVMFEIDYVLHIWLGNNIPMHSAAFCILTILANFFNSLNSAIAGIVHASGKMKKYQICGAIVNILTLPIVYVLLHFGGKAESALWTVLFVTAFNQIVCLLVLKTIIEYSLIDYFKKVLMPFLLVVGMTIWFPLAITFIMQEGFLRLVINFISSILVVGISIWIVGLNPNEKTLVRKMAEDTISKKCNIKFNR